ncbi:hypothetical protein HYH03_007970 [Edaphochlamys debaryana]|uniref:SANT and BTB domain-containing protein n=1 Tax=Edaphochlamys debaryana TaxID=47281 RepID=A0A835Y210_9CHLO|nr:hypothetical protein HYH03_007970 [Edaphochlamys debaryana]|eukprot:KAG2493747.1 hypothetical protein HYH03_007970 [Edaphochlamys debaryana]
MATAVVRVSDPARPGTTRDFTCSVASLTQGMRYFQGVVDKAQLNRTTSPLEISVHCDVAVFEWLLGYCTGKHSRADIAPERVLPLLISSHFLQMDALVSDCLSVMAEQLPAVAAAAAAQGPRAGGGGGGGGDLTALPPELLARLAKLAPERVLEELCSGPAGQEGRARHAALAQRLYKLKLESGLRELRTTLARCSVCQCLFSLADRPKLPCAGAPGQGGSRPGARGERGGSGAAGAGVHIPDASWRLQEHLSSLRAAGVGWRAIYWHVWGLVQVLYCHCCMQYAPACELRRCTYHPQPAVFSANHPTTTAATHHRPPSAAAAAAGGGGAGFFPCCGAPARRGADPRAMTNGGCCAREHRVVPSGLPAGAPLPAGLSPAILDALTNCAPLITNAAALMAADAAAAAGGGGGGAASRETASVGFEAGRVPPAIQAVLDSAAAAAAAQRRPSSAATAGAGKGPDAVATGPGPPAAAAAAAAPPGMRGRGGGGGGGGTLPLTGNPHLDTQVVAAAVVRRLTGSDGGSADGSLDPGVAGSAAVHASSHTSLAALQREAEQLAGGGGGGGGRPGSAAGALRPPRGSSSAAAAGPQPEGHASAAALPPRPASSHRAPLAAAVSAALRRPGGGGAAGADGSSSDGGGGDDDSYGSDGFEEDESPSGDGAATTPRRRAGGAGGGEEGDTPRARMPQGTRAGWGRRSFRGPGTGVGAGGEHEDEGEGEDEDDLAQPWRSNRTSPANPLLASVQAALASQREEEQRRRRSAEQAQRRQADEAAAARRRQAAAREEAAAAEEQRRRRQPEPPVPPPQPARSQAQAAAPPPQAPAPTQAQQPQPRQRSAGRARPSLGLDVGDSSSGPAAAAAAAADRERRALIEQYKTQKVLSPRPEGVALIPLTDLHAAAAAGGGGGGGGSSRRSLAAALHSAGSTEAAATVGRGTGGDVAAWVAAAAAGLFAAAHETDDDDSAGAAGSSDRAQSAASMSIASTSGGGGGSSSMSSAAAQLAAAVAAAMPAVAAAAAVRGRKLKLELLHEDDNYRMDLLEAHLLACRPSTRPPNPGREASAASRGRGGGSSSSGAGGGGGSSGAAAAAGGGGGGMGGSGRARSAPRSASASRRPLSATVGPSSYIPYQHGYVNPNILQQQAAFGQQHQQHILAPSGQPPPHAAAGSQQHHQWQYPLNHQPQTASHQRSRSVSHVQRLQSVYGAPEGVYGAAQWRLGTTGRSGGGGGRGDGASGCWSASEKKCILGGTGDVIVDQSNGVCDRRCKAGYYDVNGVASDGCEAKKCPAGTYSATGYYLATSNPEASCTPALPHWVLERRPAFVIGAWDMPSGWPGASSTPGYPWYMDASWWTARGFDAAAKWIWSSMPDNTGRMFTVDTEIAILTRQFEATEGVPLELYIAADNAAHIFIDGVFLATGSGGWGGSGGPVQVFALPALTTGVHMIKLRGMNAFSTGLNPAAVLAGIRTVGTEQTVIVTDASWTRAVANAPEAADLAPSTTLPFGLVDGAFGPGKWVWTSTLPSPPINVVSVFTATYQTAALVGTATFNANHAECGMFVNNAFIGAQIGLTSWDVTLNGPDVNGGMNTFLIRCTNPIYCVGGATGACTYDENSTNNPAWMAFQLYVGGNQVLVSTTIAPWTALTYN